MTCKKTQGFLESAGIEITTTVDASKVRYGPEQALDLLTKADRLVSLKGKKVVAVDLKKEKPDQETMLGLMMGPTGNLRAPTIRIGKTVIVGFNEASYQELLQA